MRVLWRDSEIYGRGIGERKSRTNYKKMRVNSTPFTGWFRMEEGDTLPRL